MLIAATHARGGLDLCHVRGRLPRGSFAGKTAELNTKSPAPARARQTDESVIVVDDLHAELALIDENLCRNDLTPAERAAAQARRKAIYQQLHPETKAGGDRKSNGQVGQMIDTPRFDEAAAEATGQSERAVRRDVTRGEALGDDVLVKVAGPAGRAPRVVDALGAEGEGGVESLRALGVGTAGAQFPDFFFAANIPATCTAIRQPKSGEISRLHHPSHRRASRILCWVLKW